MYFFIFHLKTKKYLNGARSVIPKIITITLTCMFPDYYRAIGNEYTFDLWYRALANKKMTQRKKQAIGGKEHTLLHQHMNTKRWCEILTLRNTTNDKSLPTKQANYS